MAETWGQLSKSQIDPEKIEEAIERIVAEHNDDPEAHLGEGQALQSHKASEVIDHLAKSIVRDKLKDLEISEIKLSDDRFVYHTDFYDFDRWGKHSSGSAGFDNYNMNLRMWTAGDSDEYAIMNISTEWAGHAVRFERNPRFQTICRFEDFSGCKVHFGVSGDTISGFGFEFSNGSVYVYHGKNSTQYKTEIQNSVDLTVENLFRAVLYSGEKIEYYINDELVATTTSNIPDESESELTSTYFHYAMLREEFGESYFYIRNLKFSQE